MSIHSGVCLMHRDHDKPRARLGHPCTFVYWSLPILGYKKAWTLTVRQERSLSIAQVQLPEFYTRRRASRYTVVNGRGTYRGQVFHGAPLSFNVTNAGIEERKFAPFGHVVGRTAVGIRLILFLLPASVVFVRPCELQPVALALPFCACTIYTVRQRAIATNFAFYNMLVKWNKRTTVAKSRTTQRPSSVCAFPYMRP